MIEAIAAWIMLFIGVIRGEAQWCIASGLFAIACNLNGLWDTYKEKSNG